MSRARLETRLYVPVGHDPRDRDLDLRSDRPEDPVAELVRWLERSRGKHLALDHLSAIAVEPSSPAPARPAPITIRRMPFDGGTRLEADPPRYVVAELGGRPSSPAARAVWRAAAARIEDYRGRHGIDDPRLALGPKPPDPGQRGDWEAVSEAVTQAAEAIDQYERGLDVAEL
jgi:hypothetical protein